MKDIYGYMDEFNKGNIIEDLNSISSKIEDIENNPNTKKSIEETNKEIDSLNYQIFIKGLKLSII